MITLRTRLVTLLVLCSAVASLMAVFPSAAGAQATRTWVSGTGDDANPCSRTAPCKTFAGAISKTAVGGEINCLDPGGFGAVTITKSINIVCDNTEAGVLASLTNAILVNAPGINVHLSGLDIFGTGNGLHGIRIIQARSVKVSNTSIYGFTLNGIDFQPSAANTRLILEDVHIFRNLGNGVANAPLATGSGRVDITDSDINDNGCGVATTNHLMDNSAPNFALRCGTEAAGGGAGGGGISTNVFHSTIDGNATIGLYSNGNAATRVGDSVIVGNNYAVTAIDVSGAGGVFTWGDNYVVSNNHNGTFTGTREFL